MLTILAALAAAALPGAAVAWIARQVEAEYRRGRR